MIRRSFVEPDFNFRCIFSDCKGEKHNLLILAESEEHLRQQMVENDCTIIRISKYDLSQWKTKADAETQKLVDAHKREERVELNRNIWSEMKACLFKVFDGKCAYCESKVLHVASGDVEHYRPKKEVTEDPNHPGYYWLAYRLENLLPSCEKCNRAPAKMNHFPIEGVRASRPDMDLDKEKPLLLNPFTDKPEKDLHFPPGRDDTYFGTVKGTTKKGKATVKYCRLNRTELIEMRRKEQEYIVRDLEYHITSDRVKLKSILSEIHRGGRQFSAAARAQVSAWYEQLRTDLEMPT